MTDNPADTMLQWRTTEIFYTASMDEPDNASARQNALSMQPQATSGVRRQTPEFTPAKVPTRVQSGNNTGKEQEEARSSGKVGEPRSTALPATPETKIKPSFGAGLGTFDEEYYI